MKLHIHHLCQIRAVAMPLIGLFLLFVQPFATTVIRLAMDELRFDGLSLINIMLVALGGWILTKDWRPATIRSGVPAAPNRVGMVND